MNDIVRQKLQYIITQYGRSICDEPKRCEALLRDFCPEYKREVNVLISALKERVAAELMTASDAIPEELVLERLIRRLYDNRGIAEEFARWAVESWAIALGFISGTMPLTPVPKVKKPKPSVPKVKKPKSAVTQPKLGDRYSEPLIRAEFVYIPPGEFMMGSPEYKPGRFDDEKLHRVRLTRGFYIQTTQVTQKQWKKVIGSNPSYFKGATLPVENVSWNEAVEFCEKLSRNTGKKYRLPTEAEWEYACRAGTDTAYCFGNDSERLEKYAWFNENSGEKTHPVAQLESNAWGLYDMHGNVWEWCQDWCGDYPSGPVTDPIGPSSGSGRVERGGGWNGNAQNCRSADRFRNSADDRILNLGFRLVLPVRSAG